MFEMNSLLEELISENRLRLKIVYLFLQASSFSVVSATSWGPNSDVQDKNSSVTIWG